MQEDILEGELAHELLPEEDHPGDPEEDDVVSGLEQRAGVEHPQVIRVVRPAKHREGEQA